MKFHENSSIGSRVVPRERADRHYESLIRVAFPILRKRIMIAILKTAGYVIAQFYTRHCALQIIDIRESCIISQSVNVCLTSA